MDPLHSKAAKQLAGSAKKAGTKGKARKAARKKKKRAPTSQDAGEPAAESSRSKASTQRTPSSKSRSEPESRRQRPATTGSKEKGGKKKSCCSCDWFLSLFGLQKRKKVDDFFVFDDSASMEHSLLWTKNGDQPTADDYLEFIPEHERGLADQASNLALPKPAEDRCDY